jgi:hypothetical protein
MDAPTRELLPDRLVAAAARGMTRRRALRNSGGVALGAAVATAYLGRGSDVAAACTWSTVCGPAPLCGGTRCNGFRCDIGRADTWWAHYEGGAAPCSGTNGVNNCWETGCVNHQIWRCCDCCAKNAGCTSGDTCFDCPAGTWHKCICHSVIASC